MIEKEDYPLIGKVGKLFMVKVEKLAQLICFSCQYTMDDPVCTATCLNKATGISLEVVAGYGECEVSLSYVGKENSLYELAIYDREGHDSSVLPTQELMVDILQKVVCCQKISERDLFEKAEKKQFADLLTSAIDKVNNDSRSAEQLLKDMLEV